VLVFSRQGGRFRLLTVGHRRLPASGVRPVGPVQHVFEWFYVYGTVAPATEERFFSELPCLNAETFRIFIDAFVDAFSKNLNLLLLDNRGACTAQRPRWPTNVRAVWLPPCCPALNPTERVRRSGTSIVTCVRSSSNEALEVRILSTRCPGIYRSGDEGCQIRRDDGHRRDGQLLSSARAH
jgi:hypothetical protein